MSVHKCPLCKVTSNFTLEHNMQSSKRDTNLCIERCHNCGDYAYFEYSPLGVTPPVVSFVYPSVEEDIDKALPDDVKPALQEAYKNLDSQSWNSCVVMCRRALEEAVNHLGATGRDLKDKIKSLADSSQITPDLKEWADEGRLGGNLGAHGSRAKKWAGKEDAEEILEFTRWFLRYTSVLPNQLMERRRKVSGIDTTNGNP